MNVGAFLDFNGTIIHNDKSKEGGLWYTLKPEEIEWMDNAPDGVIQIKVKGYKTFIVTMQNAIIEGKATYESMENLFDDVQNFIEDFAFTEWDYNDPVIDDIAICTTATENRSEKIKEKCDAIQDFADEYKIDLDKSVAVGDALTDIEAYIKAGIPKQNIYHIVLPFGDQETPEGVNKVSSLFEASELVEDLT